MSILDEDLGNVNEASSAGSLAAATNFLVQQSGAGDVAQKMPRSSMVISELMDETDLTGEVLAVTPAAFALTRGTGTDPGTLYTARSIDIQEKTSNTRAITPIYQQTMFDEMVKSDGVIEQSDIDTGLTQGTVTMGTFLTGVIGKSSHWMGSFTYQSNLNEDRRFVYINNVTQPSFKQPFTAWYTRSDSTDGSYVMTGFVSAVGAATNGLGQVLLEIRNTDDRTFDTAITREMFFNFRYFI